MELGEPAEFNGKDPSHTSRSGCDSNDDCRNNETDPELSNEATQYHCIDKDGVKFCQDPRNLSEDYTALAF